jgi:hypothetical protein
LQPLNGKAAMRERGLKFIKCLVCRFLEISFEDFQKLFGSLEMIFTFAAAKTKRVH